MPGTEPVLLLWMLNVKAMFYKEIYFQMGKFQISDTVETCLKATSVTATSSLRPLFIAWQNSHTFSYKKPSLVLLPVNMANGLILKTQTVESFAISPY